MPQARRSKSHAVELVRSVDLKNALKSAFSKEQLGLDEVGGILGLHGGRKLTFLNSKLDLR